MRDDILLVEDDPGSQELVRALCAARGYGVDVAGDGFLGLRLLSERRHAVVLIDYHLPEMDGFALARLMREIVGAKGRLKLVGITADRHGLASRRGANALFDAILVKPLDPDLLYATLDRLTQPDAAGIATQAPAPAAPPSSAGQAADALWRRRGLPGRPRAVLCPDLAPDMAAAVGQAFELCAVETADIILVAAPQGLDGLRALREAGPGRFLPAFDLDGRLGRACDRAFRVDDPDAWSGLARLCRDFSDRRAALSDSVREGQDPATRLLAFLHVGDRTLSLSACADPAATIAETGLSRAALMSAVLALTEVGYAVCEAALDGVVVRLTEAGVRAVTRGPGAEAACEADAETGHDRSHPAPVLDPAPPVPPRAGSATAPDDPVVDDRRIEALSLLIGDAEVRRLRANLLGRLASAFPADAPPAAVAHEAHALIAMAGSLGFPRLSATCRALETDLAAGSDGTLALHRARSAVREVLDHGRPTQTPPAVGAR